MPAQKLVRTPDQCRKILKKNNIEIHNCNGSHRKAELPNGSLLVYSDHGEWGRGLACKITKILAAAGLLAAIIAFWEPIIKLIGF